MGTRWPRYYFLEEPKKVICVIIFFITYHNNFYTIAKTMKFPAAIVEDFRTFVSSKQVEDPMIIDDALKRVISCSYQDPVTYPYDSFEVEFEVSSVKKRDVIECDTQIKEIDVSRKDLISECKFIMCFILFLMIFFNKVRNGDDFKYQSRTTEKPSPAKFSKIIFELVEMFRKNRIDLDSESLHRMVLTFLMSMEFTFKFQYGFRLTPIDRHIKAVVFAAPITDG